MKIGCSSSSSSPLLAVVSISGSSVSWLIYAKHLFLINHSPLLPIFQNFPLFVLARPVSRILGIIGVKDVIFVIMICFGFMKVSIFSSSYDLIVIKKEYSPLICFCFLRIWKQADHLDLGFFRLLKGDWIIWSNDRMIDEYGYDDDWVWGLSSFDM